MKYIKSILTLAIFAAVISFTTSCGGPKYADTDQIKAWIREDRLQLDEAGDPEFCCLQCGVPIRSGKYCDHCKNRVLNTLNSAYHKERVIETPQHNYNNDEKNRMRFL